MAGGPTVAPTTRRKECVVVVLVALKWMPTNNPRIKLFQRVQVGRCMETTAGIVRTQEFCDGSVKESNRSSSE